MPLVRNSPLPTFDRLIAEGRTVLPSDRAMHQDIRELHIGFCNLMPDAALEATERQFFRLIGESNKIAQFHIHPFTLPVPPRTGKAADYTAQYYETFEDIRRDGLDALIITGANPDTTPKLTDTEFWAPLKELLDWSWENVTSTICSCLTTHASMYFDYGELPRRMKTKRWGVFPHRVIDRDHPFARGMNTVFDVPHSRYGDISRAQFERHGLRILAEGEESGVHMATSADGFRRVYFQGHPEYDTTSLLKEYKRETARYAAGERPDYPPCPENFFSRWIRTIIENYADKVQAKTPPPPFPDAEIEPILDNTWRDSAKSVIANWIGTVYQITNVDRKIPFMDGVDPDDPLNLKARKA